ncbi:MAG: MinD/ParA family protein [Gammaproteobacteria bacterium]|nr:MinD/ParA family protein [Gammaproteobacteria bacterium]
MVDIIDFSTQKDQASGLRRMAKPHPVRVITVASGKGGVGKTNISVNLALALASQGKDVTILDADLGLANIDVMLGLHSDKNLSNVMNGECDLDEILIDGPMGIKVIPASSGVKNMAEMTPAQHAGLVSAFSELTHNIDVLLVDTAAGISDSVVSFSRAAQEVLVVVCDEPASITDAYALIKLLNKEQGIFKFHILANMVTGPQQGREVYEKLSKVSDRFLDVALNYLGHVPHDEHLQKAVKRQKAVVEAFPRSRAAQAFQTLSKKVNNWPLSTASGGHLEFFVEKLVSGSTLEVLP